MTDFLMSGNSAREADEDGPGAATATMRAAIITAAGKVRIDRLPLPQPGAGQVRIKLEGCGVCASNLTPWAGSEWQRYPMEPGALGHEGWGLVDAVGPGVTGLAVGDRVAALSYASYAAALVPLPPELDGMAFPGEPLGCAFNIFRRADIRAGHTVAIIGIGFLGAILTRLATEAGARVIAISRRSSSLDLARHYGAEQCTAMEDHQAIIDQVRDLTHGRFCERVIEAVGKQWPLDLAAELTGERGRMIVAGYHQEGPRQVNMWLWNWRGIDVVNAHERDPLIYANGIREAVAAVASGKLDPAPLITHRYPLERLNEALDATRDKPDGFVKAVVIP
jgi:threonine dehydrogenase-like Zn-dependent dehydrogenase